MVATSQLRTEDPSALALDITTPILAVLEPALSLVPVPGLNLIPKALSVVLGQVERARVNATAVKRFKTQAGALGDVIVRLANPTDEIAKQSARDDENMDKAVERVKQSNSLKQGVEELNKTMNNLKQDAEALWSGGGREDFLHRFVDFFKGLLSASRDAEIIADMQNTLTTAVQSFEIKAAAAINEGVQEIQELLRKAEEERILNKLCPVHAAYRSVSEPKTQLMAGTRVQLLDEIQRWSTGRLPDTKDPKRVYLLSGGAGAGKSAIAYASCKLLDTAEKPAELDVPRLGASAFFDTTTGQLTAQLLFPALARQLAESQPFLRGQIIPAARDYVKKGPSQLPQVSFQELLLRPLTCEAGLVPSGLRVAIVVDGLDECADQPALQTCLEHLLDLVRKFPCFYLFVASRPIPRILDILIREDLADIVHHHELNQDLDDDGDVAKFLRAKVPEIPAYASFLDTRPECLRQLVERAGGLFIFARIALNVLESDSFRDEPEEGFRIVLSQETGLNQMDALFLNILRMAFPPDDLDRSPVLQARLISFLHTVTLLEDGRPADVITIFANNMYDRDFIQERIRGEGDNRKKALTEDDIVRYVHRLGSVVYVEQSTGDLRPIHISFYEFLLNRCNDPHYRLNRGAGHAGFATACLSLTRLDAIKECLLETPPDGRCIWNFRDSKPSFKLARAASYGFRYALTHLREASRTEELARAVNAAIAASFVPCWTRINWFEPCAPLSRIAHISLYDLKGCSEASSLPPDYAEGLRVYCFQHLSTMLNQMPEASQDQVYSAVRTSLLQQTQEPPADQSRPDGAAQGEEAVAGDAPGGPPSWVRFLSEYENSWKEIWEALGSDPELKKAWYSRRVDRGDSALR
ncbi:hypothetical protein ACG7TL_003495 [Trametes sanguinea]